MSKLTDSARGQACIRCGAEHAYACHYNGFRQQMFGKGRGQKCSDIATAEFCHKCDQRFNEGSQNEAWGTGMIGDTARSEEFLYFIMLTNIRRYKEGVL